MRYLFAMAFRPLFLFVGVCAVVLVIAWIGMWYGLFAVQLAVPAVFWHGHEMLFGFVGAAIGGFLLTAVPNWTRRAPVAGLRLVLLVTLWFAARLALLIELTQTLHMLLNSSYWLCLTFFVARDIFAAHNTRNFPVVGLLTGFSALSCWFFVDPQWTLRATMVLVILMLLLISGRIIPAFTANWLKMHRPGSSLPAALDTVDCVAMIATGCALVFWLFFPLEQIVGALLLLVSALQGYRLSRWKGLQTLQEPLLFSLHAGFAWLPIGLLLLGLAILSEEISPSAGLHAVGVGAFGSMILAVALRAAMGHSQLQLKAGVYHSLTFILIHLAAMLRVAASQIPSSLYWAAAFWTIAFTLFTGILIQIIFPPRQMHQSSSQELQIKQAGGNSAKQ